MTSAERESLALRAKAGDRAALDALWRACEADLRGHAHRVWPSYAWDPALAVEDAEQEGYLVFRQLVSTWRPAAGVPFEAFLAGWFPRHLSYRLRRLTEQGGHRSLRDTIRVTLVHLEPAPADEIEDDDPAPSGPPEPAAPPDSEALAARFAFDDLTARLLPADRALVTLCFAHDLPLIEAARRLGLSPRAASHRLQHALSILRGCLTPARLESGQCQPGYAAGPMDATAFEG